LIAVVELYGKVGSSIVTVKAVELAFVRTV
jgi:hypothetical protein